MPDVPNVPGVPSLNSYGADNVALLTSDIFVAISAFAAPQWGIYLDGLPVITPANIFTQAISQLLGPIAAVASLIGLPNIVPTTASTVEFDFSGDSPISNYPQEEGAFQSYNKVPLPATIKLMMACDGPPSVRQGFISTLNALRKSTVLVDIQTPEATFLDYNCNHLSWRRRADRGANMIVADVWFEEVNVSASTAFSTTQQPSDAAQQSTGNVQPTAAPSSFPAQFPSDI